MKSHTNPCAYVARRPQLLLVASLLALPAFTHATTVDISTLESLESNVTRLSGNINLVDAFSGEFSRVDYAGTGSSLYVGSYTPGGVAANFTTTESLTVSMDFRVAGAGSSIGLYFADSSSNNNNVLVLFNVDSSSTTDRFRVFHDGVLSTGGVGFVPGAPPSGGGADQTASTGIDTGASGWGHLSITLSAVGGDGRRIVSLTTGESTFSYSLAGTHVDWTNTLLALRLTDTAAAGGQGIDIRLTPIPEPASLGFLAGVGAFFAMISLRRTRHGR